MNTKQSEGLERTKLSLNEVDYTSEATAFALKYADRILEWRKIYGDHKPLPITLTPDDKIIWLNRIIRRSK